MAKKDTPAGADAADKKQAATPTGAPEIDPSVLDEKRQEEIEKAFSVERDADVVAELPDEKDDKANKSTDDDDIDSWLTQDTEAGASESKDPEQPKRSNPIARFFGGYWHRKKWTLPLTLLLLAGVLFAVPTSRYVVLGLFVKNDVTLRVIDSSTNKPVVSAIVALDGAKAMTDVEGKATIKARAGVRTFEISKRYYETSKAGFLVPAFKDGVSHEVKIKATGRQVPLTVVNKLTDKPVESATLKAAGTEVKTDKDGKAILVLPADKSEQTVEISADKFNGLKGTIVVTETVDPKNTFQITPSGKVYFLSKQSGKIDVVKTDLDGSSRQTIVAGTGREEERNTILLASRDWKYLALLSRRDSDKPKLYLIETGADKMTTMDEGDASFQLIGWADHTFVYSVTRNSIKEWQPKRSALKSYSATNAKLNTLDENQAEGDQYTYKVQNLSNFYLVGSKVIYSTTWNNYSYYYDSLGQAGKTDAIRSVSVNGGDRKDLKTFASDKFNVYGARLYAPDEVYFAMYGEEARKTQFFEYENGTVEAATVDEDDFYSKYYPTYLASPSGTQTFWSDQRDGKDTFFVGDKKGENQKQVAALDEHQVYGWYSDNYLLVSKKGSELYVMPASGGKVVKVTDYHRPNASFRGYGGGYGGL